MRLISGRLSAFGLGLLVAVSIARIVLTYSTLTQTIDEPAHLACGTEWLEGVDDCGPEHPPLARVAIALGPWLRGIRPRIRDEGEAEGNDILYARGEYVENLTLARAGTLPFLILACCVTYLWARRWFGAPTAFWAVFLFVNLPPVLGHAGLATTDMACCATVLAAVYQCMRWAETPSWRRIIVLALAVSSALLSKFSSIAFLPISFAVVLVSAFVWNTKTDHQIARAPWFRQALAGTVLVGLCLWAGYRFSLEPLSRGDARHRVTESSYGSPLHALADMPLPLTAMIRGIHRIYVENEHPIPTYFLGSIHNHGSWAFFPVILAVKTPIGFLLLAMAGIGAVFRRREVPWTWPATAAIAAAVALTCMTSGINMGVRHILPIYPFLAIVAGHSVAEGLRSHRRLTVMSSALLVGWIAVVSLMAHPDYLAFFNPLAEGHPERIVADSDLDWGQDLCRLSARLKALGVHEVALVYFGSARLEDAGLPHYRVLGPHDVATGYVAVSLHAVTKWYATDGSYGWVRSLTPVERIGKTIDLYYVAGSSTTPARRRSSPNGQL